ncbi:MAG TPA: GNAT family protein, partial [Polyangiaceae bacterium]|nr:GNAT family protein [Polyangiaceae bacterium]
MRTAHNHLGQPIGPALPSWSPPPAPSRHALHGAYCRLEPLDPERHGHELFDANARDSQGKNFTYLPYGPFETKSAYWDWLLTAAARDDTQFFAILEREEGRAVGICAYLRILSESGSIEIGHLNYSPLLQRTRAATEALDLPLKQAFELGYRRYEWKCDALNAPSRAAAERLGFRLEGVFRQATVYKQRSRDTAWFSIIDSEWPRLERA